RDPRQSSLLGHQRRCVYKLSCDQQVSVLSRREQITVCVLQLGQQELPVKHLQTSLDIFTAANHPRVGRVPIRAHCAKGYSAAFHFVSVMRGGSDRDAVPALRKLLSQCDAGMKIAKRSDGGNNNLLLTACVVHSSSRYAGITIHITLSRKALARTSPSGLRHRRARPLLALRGITEENTAECLDGGAGLQESGWFCAESWFCGGVFRFAGHTRTVTVPEASQPPHRPNGKAIESWHGRHESPDSAIVPL